MLYLTIADSMTVEVTIGTFSPDEQGAKLDGLFTNLKTKASLPAAVTFEFLNAKGTSWQRRSRTCPPSTLAAVMRSGSRRRARGSWRGDIGDRSCCGSATTL